jgi:hypothetical protein
VTPVAVAVCPATPLLSPDVSVSPAGVAAMQEACRAAVRALVSAAPERVVVLGEAPRLGRYDGTWDWRGFGLPAGAGDEGAGRTRLPRALGVGAWLLDDAGWRGPRDYLGIPPDTSPSGCRQQGAGLLSATVPFGVLVVGDGSARRSLKAPGHLDERAAGFDDALAAALGTADVPTLASLDAGLAAELMVGGRAVFQVLAAAAGAAVWEPALLRHEAPYGVGWFAAAWKAV